MKFQIQYFDKRFNHKTAYRQTEKGVRDFLSRLNFKAYLVSELDPTDGIYVLQPKFWENGEN
jgi:hypothetical protein